jgi:hypothetical protein
VGVQEKSTRVGYEKFVQNFYFLFLRNWRGDAPPSLGSPIYKGKNLYSEACIYFSS